MKTSVKNRLWQVVGTIALLLGIASCDKYLIDFIPKGDKTISGEAQVVTLKTTKEISHLFVKEGREGEDAKSIYAPSSQIINGDWYTVSYDPESKKKIYISVTENRTGASRKLLIIACRKAGNDITTVTQLPL